VSSTPPRESTGLALLIGGQYLRTLDFDSGQISGLSQARLRPGDYVTDLRTAAQTYAVVTKCGIAPTRALRIGANGTISDVTLPSSIDTVLADGAHAWGVIPPSPPTAENTPGYLIPLDGGPRVRLPANFYPLASATGGVIIGSAGGTGPLQLVDAATGHLRANLGTGEPVAVGYGVVLWSVGCDISLDESCTLHSRSVAGGATSSYRLPRPPGFAIGTISPDGRLVAFTLERAGQDPRYQARHPIPPSDIAILHLDSGRLEIVPGIETPPKESPGLVFSPDSRWLVIALDAGSRIRLLAWRSGLAHPYESRSMVEQALGTPPVAVLTSHTGG
jgi:hypothetical protein